MATTPEFGRDDPQRGDRIENYYLPDFVFTVIRVVTCEECVSDDERHNAVQVTLDDLSSAYFCGHDVRKVS